MSQPMLTGWFQPKAKPVRIGVYQTRFADLEGFSHWNGRIWSLQQNDIEAAYAHKDDTELAVQDKQWRGLTKSQKKEQA